MDAEDYAWPAWKFGMRRDTLFTSLHETYNTVSSTLQDPAAFHHDVYETAVAASTVQEFHRLLADRRDQRLRELNSTFESAALEIAADPNLVGFTQWVLALQLFRTRSLDSLVRYFSSYFPQDHPWHSITRVQHPVAENVFTENRSAVSAGCMRPVKNDNTAMATDDGSVERGGDGLAVTTGEDEDIAACSPDTLAFSSSFMYEDEGFSSTSLPHRDNNETHVFCHDQQTLGLPPSPRSMTSYSDTSDAAAKDGPNFESDMPQSVLTPTRTLSLVSTHSVGHGNGNRSNERRNGANQSYEQLSGNDGGLVPTQHGRPFCPRSSLPSAIDSTSVCDDDYVPSLSSPPIHEKEACAKRTLAKLSPSSKSGRRNRRCYSHIACNKANRLVLRKHAVRALFLPPHTRRIQKFIALKGQKAQSVRQLGKETHLI